jgi:hypothetical protein
VSPVADILLLSDFAMCACWADASTKKQYVLGTKLSHAKMYLVNIANTAEQQQIASAGQCAPLWTGLSTDKKWLAGDFCDIGSLGIIQLNPSNPSQIAAGLRSYNPNGCWSTIARDATGDCLHQVESGTDPVYGSFGGHQGWVIASPTNGTYKQISLLKPAPDGYRAPLSANQACLVTRWASDRDHVTATRQGADDSHVGSGGEDPFVYRISTRHWTSVYRASPEVCSETDMYVYSSTGIAGKPRTVVSRKAAAHPRLFDLRGRLVGSRVGRETRYATSVNPGVLIVDATAGGLLSNGSYGIVYPSTNVEYVLKTG